MARSLAGGTGLPRLDTSRLRATWLADCAQRLGLTTSLQAAGITFSQLRRRGPGWLNRTPPARTAAPRALTQASNATQGPRRTTSKTTSGLRPSHRPQNVNREPG